jgi:aryl-alcohol dehydrogenase-like predicted oxidoreductase
MKNNQPIVEFVWAFGAKNKATPAQIALGWLVARKPWIVSIPDTGDLDHGAINVQPSIVDLCELETGLDQQNVHDFPPL